MQFLNESVDHGFPQIHHQIESPREVRQAVRDACEQEWREIKILHDQAVESWKAESVRLNVVRMQPRDLPTKPKLVVEDKLDDNEDDESYRDE